MHDYKDLESKITELEQLLEHLIADVKEIKNEIDYLISMQREDN